MRVDGEEEDLRGKTRRVVAAPNVVPALDDADGRDVHENRTVDAHCSSLIILDDNALQLDHRMRSLASSYIPL